MSNQILELLQAEAGRIIHRSAEIEQAAHEVADAARQVAQDTKRLSEAAAEYQKTQATGSLTTNDSFDTLLIQFIKQRRDAEQEERLFDQFG